MRRPVAMSVEESWVGRHWSASPVRAHMVGATSGRVGASLMSTTDATSAGVPVAPSSVPSGERPSWLGGALLTRCPREASAAAWWERSPGACPPPSAGAPPSLSRAPGLAWAWQKCAPGAAGLSSPASKQRGQRWGLTVVVAQPVPFSSPWRGASACREVGCEWSAKPACRQCWRRLPSVAARPVLAW